MLRNGSQALVIVVLLLVAAAALGGDDKQAQGNALLRRARDVQDIRAQGAPAFQLTAKVRLWNLDNQPVEGTFTETWADLQHWRTELRMPDYSETIVRRGNSEFRARSLPYIPVPVGRLHTLLKLSPRQLEVGATVKKIKVRAVNGSTVTCLRLLWEKRSEEELCFENATGMLLSGSTAYQSTSYSVFQPFGGRVYPRKVSAVSKEKQPLADVEISDIRAATGLSDATWALPEGAEEYPVCENMVHPNPISTPDPHYTDYARARHVQGTVVLTVKIGANGKVERAVVAQSLDPGVDENAIRAVQSWTLEPAKCGTTPVPTEISVEINFDLR